MVTWTCHVCGSERPDDKISVCTNQKIIGNITIPMNVRYCNDIESCINAAPHYDFLEWNNSQ